MKLGQISKQLKFSQETIVSFLSDIGYEIQNDPGTPLNSEILKLIKFRFTKSVSEEKIICPLCKNIVKVVNIQKHLQDHAESQNNQNAVPQPLHSNINTIVVKSPKPQKESQSKDDSKIRAVDKKAVLSDDVDLDIVLLDEIDPDEDNLEPAPSMNPDLLKATFINPIYFSFKWPSNKKFQYFVRRWYAGNHLGHFLNHPRLKGIYLQNLNMASEYTSALVDEFRYYFDYKSTTLKCLNVDRVFRDFPEFWGQEAHENDKFYELKRGLSDEIKYQEQNKSYIKLRIIKTFPSSGSLKVYKAEVISQKDIDTQMQEEVILKITLPFHASLLVLDHDVSKNILYFESITTFKNKTELTVEYNAAWILKKLKFRITSLILNNNLVWNKIINSVGPVTAENIEKYIYNQNRVSQDQALAIEKCLNHDLTFIWGPPGTGKSTTIASLLEEFAIRKEKTLVCSIANVAVDGLLIKFIDGLKKYNPQLFNSGTIIRAGNTFSETILKEDKLFDSKQKSKELKEKINEIKLKLNIEMVDNDKVKLIQEFKSLRNKLKEVQSTAYNSANFIFCTAAYSLFDEALLNFSFDNVIVDEVSMMNIPYLLWLGQFANKRIIVTGDFRQLGPISSAKSRFANKWMKRDVFRLINSEYNFSNNAPVFQLTSQYRMNDTIKNIINPFYQNKLSTISQPHQTRFSKIYSDRPLLYKFVSIDSKIGRSSSGSKYNEKNFKITISMVQAILESLGTLNQTINIGIVTPFREQANKYSNHFSEFKVANISIETGTIHTFQGSESDIILFDLVESKKDIDDKNNEISALFYEQDGERLINVAISRAKSKLIVIGDIDALTQSSTHMTSRLFKDVLKSLRAQ